ncbi:MAG: hypothetical protein V5A68_07400 [Candidatus Thermoplasmatota archaeon]
MREVIENHVINKNNFQITADEIAALIDGDINVLEDRIFWRVLISSQLDADRIDYLIRDSYHIGVKYGVLDYKRLLNTIAVGIDPDDEEPVLGIYDDGWHVAESLVMARYQMFTQVYFHRVRRAYDFHLQKAIETILEQKNYPSPEKINDYLKLDDYKVYNSIINTDRDYHCNSIKKRNHIRLLRKTPEIPNKKDVKKKNDWIDKLKNNNIWHHEDIASKAWYKMTGDEESNQIMIINRKDQKVNPLAEHSNIVKKMGEIKQIRIYVKPQDKKKAEKII